MRRKCLLSSEFGPRGSRLLVACRQEQSGARPNRGSPLLEPQRVTVCQARRRWSGSCDVVLNGSWSLWPAAASSSVYFLLGACSRRKSTYGLCTSSSGTAKDGERSGTSEKPTDPSGSGRFSGPACQLGRKGTFGFLEARAVRGRHRATGAQASHDRYGYGFHPSRRLSMCRA